jgi:hypothetical protein
LHIFIAPRHTRTTVATMKKKKLYKYCKTHARYHSIFTLISLQMAFIWEIFAVWRFLEMNDKSEKGSFCL